MAEEVPSEGRNISGFGVAVLKTGLLVGVLDLTAALVNAFLSNGTGLFAYFNLLRVGFLEWKHFQTG